MSTRRMSVVAALAIVGLAALAAPAQFRGNRRPGMPDGSGDGGAGATVGGDASAAKDLHIANGRTVNFNINLNDGANYLWDFQGYLNVGQGSNNAYQGGMYLHVFGNNVNNNTGNATMNAAGDELEIGPCNSRGNLQVYRRCKVYKDQGLARWLEIFVNTGNAPVQISAREYSNICGGPITMTTSTGGANFTDKDFAFITDCQGRPSLLHIVCSPKTKLTPVVQVQNGNGLSTAYNFTVAPNSTAILCVFESQGQTTAELTKRMKEFRFSKAVSDLSPALRKLIVNFRTGGDMEGVDLDRSGSNDKVCLRNDDAIFGRITNEKFTIEAFYGTLPLPADQVVGFASAAEEDQVRAVLVGGQVVTGKLKEPTLKLALPTGGELEIPFARIRQCSYKISKAKPEDAPMKDPLIVLRTGDRLSFDAAALKCVFQTRHGKIDLVGKDLLEVRMDQEDHGIHRAQFMNGSSLAGVLGPERIKLPVRLGPTLDIARDMIHSIRFAGEGSDADSPARVALSNGDELAGKLVDEAYTMTTEFGSITIKPANIVSVAFADKSDPSKVAIKLWDNSVLRGRLQQEALRFQITPGPQLNLALGQVVSLECAGALPPDDMVKQVEKLVGQLAAANFQDREAAQEQLIGMGATIAPLLKKFLKDNDPEVRHRVQTVMERIGGAVPSPVINPDNDPQVMEGMIWLNNQGLQPQVAGNVIFAGN